MTNKKELCERLRAAHAKGPHYFAKRYRTADEVARLAYNTTAIEGRCVSHDGLRASAEVLLKEAKP